MSTAQFSIVYDGPALRAGTMDVRDLAPALLAFGQLFDAANRTLNGDAARVNVNVHATKAGSFGIDLDLTQTIVQQLTALFAGDSITAALNLKQLVVDGAVVGCSLIGLIKWLRGGKPDKIEDLGDGVVRITLKGEAITVPMKLVRLYQDLAVRDAAYRAVAEPLGKEGIDVFKVVEGETVLVKVTEAEAEAFARPVVPDETIIESRHRSAFTIVSLAFKEDNKWRLYDGNTQISASIADEEFLERVDSNQISFSKGDILVCDVLVTQKRTREGLRTDYVVQRVIEHRPAARQLSLLIEPPRGRRHGAESCVSMTFKDGLKATVSNPE